MRGEAFWGLKTLKNQELPGALPPGPPPGRCPWTPPGALERAPGPHAVKTLLSLRSTWTQTIFIQHPAVTNPAHAHDKYTGFNFALSHPQDTRTCQTCNPQVLEEIYSFFFNLNFMNIQKINRFIRLSHCKACWSSWKFTGWDQRTSKIDPWIQCSRNLLHGCTLPRIENKKH